MVRSAVLVTGVYGTGKSSVVEEMAGVLEARGAAYAALDLDWLWWFDAPDLGPSGHREVLMANLGGVVGNYLAAGVARFLMAWAVPDADALRQVRSAVPFAVRVAELRVPVAAIRARLGAAVTAERARDLAAAERWLDEARGAGLADAEFSNDRPITETASAILSWLGWG